MKKYHHFHSPESKKAKSKKFDGSQAGKKNSASSFTRLYEIQLAAVRSANSARKEWTRLRTRNRALLDKLTLNIVRVDLGRQGVFFRLRAGPIKSEAGARSLCRALTEVKVGCLVVAPSRKD